MHADRKRQAARTAQGKRDKNRQQRYRNPILPTFVRLGVIVQRAESDRLEDRSRPESQAIGQRIHKIAAKQYFFAEPDEQIRKEPQSCEFQKLRPRYIQPVYAVAAAEKNQQDHGRRHQKTPHYARPELAPKKLAQAGNSVNRQGSTL